MDDRILNSCQEFKIVSYYVAIFLPCSLYALHSIFAAPNHSIYKELSILKMDDDVGTSGREGTRRSNRSVNKPDFRAMENLSLIHI